MVVHGHVSKYFTINEDAGLTQTINKATVAKVVSPSCCVDTNDPQHPELSFTLTSISVGVLIGLHYRLVSYPKYVFPGTTVAFRTGEDLGVSGAGRNTSFYSGHDAFSR